MINVLIDKDSEGSSLSVQRALLQVWVRTDRWTDRQTATWFHFDVS